MRNLAYMFSMWFTLMAMTTLLFISLNGCAIVVHDKNGVWHHAGISIETSPSVYIRIGSWYCIPIEENTCDGSRQCLQH